MQPVAVALTKARARLLASSPRPPRLSHLQPVNRSLGRAFSVHSAPIRKLLELKPEKEIRDVVVNGFVRSMRSMKSYDFIALGDGSSVAPLQALVPKGRAEGCG
jgi:asparaginyl-tRNA synthetase